MEIVALHFEEEPGSRNHSLLRETAWTGGEFVEARYFLSWATGINEFQRSHEEFIGDYQSFVIGAWPASQMFLKSRYWIRFFMVLLRHRYRESETGKSFPIRSESKDEKALRILLTNPSIQHTEIVKALNTTEKQVLRMTSFQLAFSEVAQNFQYPHRTKNQRNG